MDLPLPMIQEWLASITDEELRLALRAAIAIVSEAPVEDEAEEIFKPYVYPH